MKIISSNVVILLASLIAINSHAQSYEPCIVEIVSMVKDLKIVDARKAYHKDDCNFQYKDEFGEKVSINKESIKTLIENVDAAEKTCQNLKTKIDANGSSINSIVSGCGTKWWGYRHLVEAEKYSGVPITEFSKNWDKFVDEIKAAQEKKESDAELAEEKAKEKRTEEANSPDAIRKNACYANNVVQAYKESIRKEKAAAKHSGIVDKARLHTAGQFIETYGESLEAEKAKYKKKTGKEWFPALCK